MEENNAKLDFNAIKRPVFFLAILPAIVIIFLASLSISQRVSQLNEADKTKKLVSFSQLLVDFTHHLAREQVAKETLEKLDSLSQWQERTDNAWFSVLNYYTKNISDERFEVIDDYIERTGEIVKNRRNERESISTEKLDYIFSSPRLIMSSVLGVSSSKLYQKNMQSLLTFLKAKENVYGEGVLLSKVLKKGSLTQEDFEILTKMFWNQSEFFKLFEDYASEKQLALYEVKKLNPVFEKNSEIHERIFLRLKEYELLSKIGYLGLIHHFKNYVLRGDEKYFIKARGSYLAAKDVIKDIESVDIPHENLALNNIVEMLDNYNSMLSKAKALKQKGLSAAQIDQQVVVDDSLAEASLLKMKTAFFRILLLCFGEKYLKEKLSFLEMLKMKL